MQKQGILYAAMLKQELEIFSTVTNTGELNFTHAMCSNPNISKKNFNRTFELSITHPYWICEPDLDYVIHCVFGASALAVFVLSVIGTASVIGVLMR